MSKKNKQKNMNRYLNLLKISLLKEDLQWVQTKNYLKFSGLSL